MQRVILGLAGKIIISSILIFLLLLPHISRFLSPLKLIASFTSRTSCFPFSLSHLPTDQPALNVLLLLELFITRLIIKLVSRYYIDMQRIWIIYDRIKFKRNKTRNLTRKYEIILSQGLSHYRYLHHKQLKQRVTMFK